jgi:hypothetical protein
VLARAGFSVCQWRIEKPDIVGPALAAGLGWGDTQRPTTCHPSPIRLLPSRVTIDEAVGGELREDFLRDLWRAYAGGDAVHVLDDGFQVGF